MRLLSLFLIYASDRFLEAGQKKKIKYMGIDRSHAYKAAALRHRPHVKVCYDAYHLVSNMNQTLDRIRRFTMKHPSYALEQFMKGKRYVLLRGRETISRDANTATLRLILWIKMSMKSKVNL